MTRFGSWKRLTEENIHQIPETLGVYQVKLPRKIHRLLGTDNNGIMVIGFSKNLSNRLDAFYKSIRPITEYKTGFHGEGVRFCKLKLYKIFKVERFLFRYKTTKTIKKAKKLEALELEKYQWLYGELPPLNNSGGY